MSGRLTTDAAVGRAVGEAVRPMCWVDGWRSARSGGLSDFSVGQTGSGPTFLSGGRVDHRAWRTLEMRYFAVRPVNFEMSLAKDVPGGRECGCWTSGRDAGHQDIPLTLATTVSKSSILRFLDFKGGIYDSV